MDREERMELILDHYEDPRNYGRLDGASVVQKWGNPGCGDIVEMWLRIEDDRIADVAFEGEGCTISQAGASMITEMVKGKTLAEVEAIPRDAIIEILGRELAMTRPRCSTLGLDTVRAAIRAHRRKVLREEIEASAPERGELPQRHGDTEGKEGDGSS